MQKIKRRSIFEIKKNGQLIFLHNMPDFSLIVGNWVCELVSNYAYDSRVNRQCIVGR